MAKQLTPEEIEAKLEKTSILLTESTDREAALKNELEKTSNLLTESTDREAALTEELDLLKGKYAVVTKEVPGTFTYEKKQYRFKKGHLKTRVKGELVDSSALISDPSMKEHMISLIKINYGGLEIVEQTK